MQFFTKNYAKNLVSEDITHTETPMGLIGIKIRIARKEKIVPEFELNKIKSDETKPDSKDGKSDEASSESEKIIIEEEKIKKIETLEEEESRLK